MSVESGLSAQVRNIEQKYGRSMAEWAATLREQGIDKPGLATAYLKRGR